MKILMGLLAILAFGSPYCYCQTDITKQIDSLNGIALSFVSDPDSLAHYADRAYSMSKSASYETGLATAAKMKGIAAYFTGNFGEAIRYYEESLLLQQALGDSLEVAKAHYNLAMTYNAQWDLDNTTQHAMKGIRIFNQLGDVNGQARVYNLLGIAASRHKALEKALSYFKKYDEMARQAGDSLEIATALNNLGGTYTDLERTDSALHALQKAAGIYQLLGGHRNLAGTYQNIGLLLESEGDLPQATEYLEKALGIAQQENNHPREVSVAYNLGRLMRKLGNRTRAAQLLELAGRGSREMGDRQILYHTLEQQAYLRYDNHQYKDAYEILLESTLYRDTLFDIELTKVHEELAARYERENKEQEIHVLSQENIIQKLRIEQQKIWLLVAAILIIALIVGAWLLMYQRKLRAEAVLQRELLRKQEEDALTVLDAEEKERERIAADLHDGVGQLLSVALLNLSQLQKQLKEGFPPKDIAVDNTINVVRESYKEMRDIAHQMMPNALLKTGLAYSVRDFLNKIDSTRLSIQLDVVGLDARLQQQTEVLIYRCIQEAVNNVIKHAQAKRLSIQLVKDEDGLTVSIEDNGVGFDPSQPGKEGIGLKNIRSRVALLRGSLEVDAVPGKGTLLVIQIPEHGP